MPSSNLKQSSRRSPEADRPPEGPDSSERMGVQSAHIFNGVRPGPHRYGG
jgi:hypothetical protein